MFPGLITLLTDFGLDDAYVGIMKGVMLRINPAVRLVDLTHAVPPEQVLAAALILRSAVAFFPEGTIHVAVVDPGVGSARRAILIEADRGTLVGPDNGVLCPAAALMGRRKARWLANEKFFLRGVSQSFHGRDIFAPVAAHLSRGVTPEEFGPVLDSIVEVDIPAPRRFGSTVVGEVVHVDRFGNLVTNITGDALACFPAQQLWVSISGTRIGALRAAYSVVAEGAALALLGSWGTVEVAVRNGSAAKMFAAGPGTPVTVVVESRET
ncbi:MAG: SAM-dependent chlorinase/fluorinase [Candidatus Binatia bacterium]|jgi:S-adenosyl-L-methionine hydrolase (adenosine-forming)